MFRKNFRALIQFIYLQRVGYIQCIQYAHTETNLQVLRLFQENQVLLAFPKQQSNRLKLHRTIAFRGTLSPFGPTGPGCPGSPFVPFGPGRPSGPGKPTPPFVPCGPCIPGGPYKNLHWWNLTLLFFPWCILVWVCTMFCIIALVVLIFLQCCSFRAAAAVI